jgi:type I restriction enzyme S subunit
MNVAGMSIDLPQTWKWAQCSEVIDVRDGTHDTPKYTSDGYPLVTSKNLKPEGIDFSTISYISEADHIEVCKRSRVDKGDILFAMIGTIGNPVLVDIDTEFSIKNVALFKFSESPIDAKYFKYLLKSPLIQRQLDIGTKGGTQKFVSLKVLRSLAIPFPHIEEQQRIAAILDKADAVRRKRKEAIRLTEDLLRAAFLEMFGDPVTNPKGWEVDVLGNIGTLERGKSKHRPRNDPSLLNGPYPLIQTGEVSNSNGLITEYTQTYSEKGLAQSRMWPTGTLCITIAANIADTGILTFDACFPDSIVGFKPNDSAISEYVQGWFGFLQPVIEEKAPQVAQKNINLKILRELEIPVPPLEVQKGYAKAVSLVREHTQRKLEQIKESENLFNSLLQRAFRGEL